MINGKLSTAAVVIITVFIAAADLIIFEGNSYTAMTVILSLIACVPYYSSKGDRIAATKELWVMVVWALISGAMLLISSVSGFFRPYTAVTVAAGMFFGAPAGFTCGFFSVLLSALVRGTGGWTVHQLTMLGLIGFLAGILRKGLITKTSVLIVFSFISSVMYSSMGIYERIWDPEKGFESSAYKGILFRSMKWYLLYAVVDIMAVLLVKKYFYRKMVRLKRRFRIFEYGK